MPKKRWSYFIAMGVEYFFTALTFSGSGRIPSGVIRWPIKFTPEAPIMNLSGRATNTLTRNKDNTDRRCVPPVYPKTGVWKQCTRGSWKAA